MSQTAMKNKFNLSLLGYKLKWALHGFGEKKIQTQNLNIYNDNQFSINQFLHKRKRKIRGK